MKKIAYLFILILSACSHVPVPDGYRMNQYKAPVPSFVPGGEVISVQQAYELKQHGLAFIDVVGSGKLLTRGIEDDWLVVKSNMSIPDSYWLPDVGRGALTPKQETYFRTSLQKITQGDMSQPLVFFCLKDCWMSWNATKRAASYGYTSLYWLPDGKDGWAAQRLDLKEIKPF